MKLMRLAALLLTAFLYSPSLYADVEAETQLESLARQRFGELQPAEVRLVRATAGGQALELSRSAAEELDPGGNPDPDRVIRAEVLAWLCTSPQAAPFVDHRGVTVRQAYFRGRLQLAYAKLAFPLTLTGCQMPGGMDAHNCDLVELNLTGTRLSSLNADQVRVERDLTLAYGFTAEKEVRLHFARIAGNLECSGGRFLNDSPDALFADGLRVEGDVLLRYEFEATHRVSLDDARIRGNLDCEHGSFSNPADVALNLQGVAVDGDILLVNAELQGALELGDGEVLGGVNGNDARLLFAGGTAVRGYALDVKGDVKFIDATIVGTINLESCEVGRDLNFADASITDLTSPAVVILQGATVARRFRWTGISTPEEIGRRLDLRSAHAGIFLDDAESWPAAGELYLHGFTYDEIHDDAPFDAETRIEWLRRQPTARFRSQPYEQLAEVLKTGGQGEAARAVLIAKEQDRAARTRLTPWEWYWYHLLGPMIGYGYEPWRAFYVIIGVILLGAVFFQCGYWGGLMTATKEAEFVYEHGDVQPRLSANYPRFNALVYSFDVFTPLTYLHQADYWMPNPTVPRTGRGSRMKAILGSLLRTYMWGHVIAGWTLTSLFVAGITGLVEH